MRAAEIIIESMSFEPIIQSTMNDGKKIWTSEPFGTEHEIDCAGCNGTGEWGENKTCRYCNGTGKETDFVLNAPNLNVSNSNGAAILDMLGINFDYDGIIEYDSLPDIMRKLIKLKNSYTGIYTVKPTTDVGQTRRIKDPETGMSSIGRGPTIHHGGRSDEQVKRYINTLIELVRFAQANKASIGWS